MTDRELIAAYVREGSQEAFRTLVAHHLDISGGDPGLNMAATDVYSEGLIIPPVKLNMARDWHGGAFERILRANVRVPHQTMGDFDAQVAWGGRTLSEIAGKTVPLCLARRPLIP